MFTFPCPTTWRPEQLACVEITSLSTQSICSVTQSSRGTRCQCRDGRGWRREPRVLGVRRPTVPNAVVSSSLYSGDEMFSPPAASSSKSSSPPPPPPPPPPSSLLLPQLTIVFIVTVVRCVWWGTYTPTYTPPHSCPSVLLVPMWYSILWSLGTE